MLVRVHPMNFKCLISSEKKANNRLKECLNQIMPKYGKGNKNGGTRNEKAAVNHISLYRFIQLVA